MQAGKSVTHTHGLAVCVKNSLSFASDSALKYRVLSYYFPLTLHHTFFIYQLQCLFL